MRRCAEFKAVCHLLVFSGLAASVALAEYPVRVWTSVSGNKIEARYVPDKRGFAESDRVPLEQPDGNLVKIHILALSTEDRQWLADLTNAARKTAFDDPRLKADISDFNSDWKKLDRCTLIPNESNDGDSFHVMADGKEYIFRLYGADTPESEEDDQLAERLVEQATHFGIPVSDVPKHGKEAAQFTAKILSEPFTVMTKMQVAMGRSKLPRHYAFVFTGQGQDLTRVLLYAGMARSFGVPVKTDSDPSSELKQELDKLEAEAKEGKRGIWAAGGNPTSSRPLMPR